MIHTQEMLKWLLSREDVSASLLYDDVREASVWRFVHDEWTFEIHEDESPV